MLGLYGGRVGETERTHPAFDTMIEEFSGWFERAMTKKYGGIDCKDVIAFDPALKAERCPSVILDSWLKIKEILEQNEVNPAGPAPALRAED